MELYVSRGQEVAAALPYVGGQPGTVPITFLPVLQVQVPQGLKCGDLLRIKSCFQATNDAAYPVQLAGYVCVGLAPSDAGTVSPCSFAGWGGDTNLAAPPVGYGFSHDVLHHGQLHFNTDYVAKCNFPGTAYVSVCGYAATTEPANDALTVDQHYGHLEVEVIRGAFPNTPQQWVADAYNWPGYTETGGPWASFQNSWAWYGDERWMGPGAGSASLTVQVPPGNYWVGTTWVPWAGQATAAKWQLFDGAGTAPVSLGTYTVDLTQSPRPDALPANFPFQKLATVHVGSGSLRVVALADPGAGVVFDAVRVAAV